MTAGLDASPIHEVLIEESVLGWKEFEMEVVRDRADNCIIVCSIENVDPMGVHTGDSITVAPALTLTDKEYQRMRNASIAVLREIGVDTGGSNVQFAINPADGRMVIIEMNPRVSRSSALASKATGFPIAKVAAKLAVGYTLDEITNDITGVTPASFEPTIDYVVTKMPRFTFEKFPADRADPDHLDEVGRRGHVDRPDLRGIAAEGAALAGDRPQGLDEVAIEGLADGPAAGRAPGGARPADPRPAAGDRAGLPRRPRYREIQCACRLRSLVPRPDPRARRRPRSGCAGTACRRTPRACSSSRRWASRMPVSAQLAGLSEDDVARAARHWACIRCTSGSTPARPSSRHARPISTAPTRSGRDEGEPAECEASPSDRQKVIILGGGPNRIGQGIEFDYCCVHAAFGLHEAGFETIMVNCNPETVSTDYDTSDRLYFEPLTAEDVLEIVRVEAREGELLGVIVQFGGQTPLKLAHALAQAGVPILGTSPDAIDLAEDRERFQGLLDKLGLRQPINGIGHDPAEAAGQGRAARLPGGNPTVLRAGRTGDARSSTTPPRLQRSSPRGASSPAQARS